MDVLMDFIEKHWKPAICCVIVLLVITTTYAIWDAEENTQRITLEGVITNVELIKESSYDGSHVFNVSIQTDDDLRYFDIQIWDDVFDFTVNSKFIIKLVLPANAENWRIDAMFKVPGGD